MRLIIITLIIFWAGASMAQSKKNKEREKVQPNSREPVQRTFPEPAYQQDRSTKKTTRSHSSPTYQLEQEYYERMARLVKIKRKEEKILAQPQYSDPMYFGHKRKPKKHSPKKMKYCSECGIRH